jgi:DNA-binding transcriptional MerR regulator
MTARHREPARITLRMAIQRTGLSRKQIDSSISRSLVAPPLSAGDLQELRRIRRLQELGVNWAGIEIIIRLRRRIEQLQVELAGRDRVRAWHRAEQPAEACQRLLVWEPEQDAERHDGEAAPPRGC